MENLELTFIEETIMLAILNKPNYGQGIVEVVSEASNGKRQIGTGTLYPALKRLEHRGVIQAKEVKENLDIRNGHSRRYYQVTQKGKEMLDEMERMRAYIRSQNGVTQLPSCCRA